MKIDIFDTKAKVVDSHTLGPIFTAKVSPQLIAQAIRVYLSNQRKSQASTKNRSQVSGTTKKMWAQKGTGRARHSSRKAPIFVGGGVAHGPQGNQNWSLKLSKKMKKQALASTLSSFAAANKVFGIKDITKLPPKTKSASQLIAALAKNSSKIESNDKIALITCKSIDKTKRAFANLPQVSLLNLSSLNVYHLAQHQVLLFSQKALQKINQR